MNRAGLRAIVGHRHSRFVSAFTEISSAGSLVGEICEHAGIRTAIGLMPVNYYCPNRPIGIEDIRGVTKHTQVLQKGASLFRCAEGQCATKHAMPISGLNDPPIPRRSWIIGAGEQRRDAGERRRARVLFRT